MVTATDFKTLCAGCLLRLAYGGMRLHILDNSTSRASSLQSTLTNRLNIHKNGLLAVTKLFNFQE